MATDNKQIDTIQSIRQEIEQDYIVDEFVDAAWPLTIIIILSILYMPIKRLLESLAINLGKAKEVTIGGVSWKTSDLEQAVIDLEVLKSNIATAYIDNDIDPLEMDILAHKTRNMPSYIEHISKKAKEKILTESMNMAGVDGKIDPEEYILFRSKAKSLEIEFTKIDKLLIEMCITRKITPPPQLKKQYDLAKIKYGVPDHVPHSGDRV